MLNDDFINIQTTRMINVEKDSLHITLEGEDIIKILGGGRVRHGEVIVDASSDAEERAFIYLADMAAEAK